MFNVNNRSTRTRYEICSTLTVKIPERRLATFLLPPDIAGLKDVKLNTHMTLGDVNAKK